MHRSSWFLPTLTSGLVFTSLVASCVARRAVGNQCSYTSECSDGLVCGSGFCRAICRESRDCPDGHYCVPSADPSRTVCVSPSSAPLCRTSNECGPARACTPNGLCGPATCSTNADCIVLAASAWCAAGSCLVPGFDAGGATDAGVDAAGDSPGDTDAPPPDVAVAQQICLPANVVDLSREPPAPDGTIGVLSSTTRSVAMQAVPSGCGDIDFFAPVAFRYVARQRSILRASTRTVRTDAALDTVLTVLTACDVTSEMLACSDDIGLTVQSTAQTPRALAAGASVAIFVGGFFGATGAETMRGTFELQVRELPPVASGMPCDPTGRADACDDGVCALMRAGVARCVSPVSEVEPNSAPASAERAVLDANGNAAIRVRLLDSDIDCFSIDVPAGASIVAETSNGSRDCAGPTAGDSLITLHDPSGRMIASDDNGGIAPCARIDGSVSGPAHALAAGPYAVCARRGAAGSTQLALVLTMTLLPP